MQTRNLLALTLGSLALVSAIFLTACGSSGSAKTQSTPVFTSTPVTVATQDVAYTYQLTAIDPAGGTVTFSLAAAPVGTAFSGGEINTITWVPTAAQSRVSNSFAVTAKTTSGGTAQQQWAVTPGGTITVNWMNNYWGPTGAVQVPADPSVAANLSALWTNPDGSYTVQKSSWTSAGVFSIPNVPGGNYWLQAGGGNFWTSVSTFDAGSDIAGPQAPTLANAQNTFANVNLSGLDAVGQVTVGNFVVPVVVSGLGYPGFGFGAEPPQTSLSFPDVGLLPDTIDWSKIDSAFFLQYVPESLGLLNNLVIGPSVNASLTLTDGTVNTITEQLQPSPQAFVDLSVPGASQWAPLFTANAAPATPTPYSSALSISAQAYISGRLASGTGSPLVVGNIPSLTLAATTFGDDTGTAGCGVQEFNPNPQPPILIDETFGDLLYGDPFPSTWTRVLSLCQLFTAALPVPNSSATASFDLVDSASVAPAENVSLGPVVSIVQNPTINGASFFTAATLNTAEVPLTWSAPAGAAPYGYTVRAYVLDLASGIPSYNLTGGVFSVAQTSITLPPLAAGNTYVFAITAEADGTANIQTAPFRSSLPTGTATVVSAPITISSGAMTPAIHGDRRVITRLSQPQPRVAATPTGGDLKRVF